MTTSLFGDSFPIGPGLNNDDDIMDIRCPPGCPSAAHRLISADSGFVYMTIVVAPVAMAVSDVYKVA
ncbi:hypothetical protein ACN38_g7722 [Penicillium nordicum]|uniref:Uncharacterized protein n=1 Tax=Penicillium nordicum TaxID=229535 RepID=A0A0N0RYF8_9EURO|nr:hypothetical protein ACN38_g7722 [Penicillium nordicum]